MDFSTVDIDDLLIEDVFELKKDQQKLILLLQRVGLLPKERICEKCSSSMLLKTDKNIDGFVFRCYKCNKRTSIRKATFFEGAKLSLWQIFYLIFADINNIYMSYDTITKQLKIGSRETVCDWKNYIREIYIEYLNIESSSIGGEGFVVQIDESQVCKRKFHRGRVLVNQNVWVVGGIAEDGQIFQVLTEVRNQTVLDSIITQYVSPGSIIWTDLWGGYNNLSSLGYHHDKVNHSIEFKTSDGVHTNRIEAIWGAIKRKFRYITNKKSELMGSYLAEYQFKKTFKINRLSKYISIINQIYLH